MTIKNDAWEQIIDNLKTELSGSEFRTWFSHTKLGKLEDNIATIKAPNKFIVDWLKDNYLNEIRHSFKSVLNLVPEIKFVYDQRLTANNTINTSKHLAPYVSFGTGINTSMTFDSFVTGECNRFAFSSAFEVAAKPAENYNPLYIYSKLSIGKTHLLHAIGNQFIKKESTARIEYASSKLFITDYTYCIRNNKTHTFRDKYLDLDFLLFDDIQFLSNRKRLQDEFLSIFDSFYQAKKQIVVTGDRSPNRLKYFKSPIISRLGAGLLTEIKTSDQTTKINIIKYILKNYNINLSNDIILYLSNNNNNYKSLTKNIIKIGTYFSLNNGPIHISMVKSLIKKNDSATIGINEIQTITTGYFNIALPELISEKKKRVYSYPRQCAMYLCRKYTKLSYQEIGSYFGDRDHSTVLYATRKIENLKKEDKTIRDDIKNLKDLLL